MDLVNTIGSIQRSTELELRVSLGHYHRSRLVDLRQWWQPSDRPEPLPTKRGFTIPPDHLDALIDLLLDARAQAEVLGWLPSAGPVTKPPSPPRQHNRAGKRALDAARRFHAPL